MRARRSVAENTIWGEWLRESGAWDRCVGSLRVARLPPVRRRSACRASALPRGAESGRGAGSVCDGMHVGRARPSVLPAWEALLGASFFRCLNMAGEVASPAGGCVVLCVYAFAQRVKREILKAARAPGVLAVAGVPRVVPPRLRGVLPSSPPGGVAPGPGIAEAPRKGAFRLKGS